MQLHASAHRGQRRTHTVSPATPPPSARLWRATRHDALGAPGAIGCSPPQPPRTSAARARARPGAPSNNGTASPRQRRHTAGGIRWLGALRRWGTGRTRDGRPELVPRRQQSLAGVYRVPLQGLRRRQGPAVVALCAIRKSCATRVCPRHVMWRSDRNVYCVHCIEICAGEMKMFGDRRTNRDWPCTHMPKRCTWRCITCVTSTNKELSLGQGLFQL